MKKFIIVILAIIALLPLHTVSADWAGSFVVYSGDIYEISDDELIPSEEIDKKIGHVTKFSDEEGTYRGISRIFILKVRPTTQLSIPIQKILLLLRPKRISL